MSQLNQNKHFILFLGGVLIVAMFSAAILYSRTDRHNEVIQLNEGEEVIVSKVCEVPWSKFIDTNEAIEPISVIKSDECETIAFVFDSANIQFSSKSDIISDKFAFKDGYDAVIESTIRTRIKDIDKFNAGLAGSSTPPAESNVIFVHKMNGAIEPKSSKTSIEFNNLMANVISNKILKYVSANNYVGYAETKLDYDLLNDDGLEALFNNVGLEMYKITSTISITDDSKVKLIANAK